VELSSQFRSVLKIKEAANWGGLRQFVLPLETMDDGRPGTMAVCRNHGAFARDRFGHPGSMVLSWAHGHSQDAAATGI
jgi:hypothetical protein